MPISKRIVIVLFIPALFHVFLYCEDFSDISGINSTDIMSFVQNLKNGEDMDPGATYLWSGLISKIEKRNGSLEVTLIKARWLDNEMLEHYTFALVVTDTKMKKQILDIGLYNKILLLVKVIDIKDGIVPVCSPMMIKTL